MDIWQFFYEGSKYAGYTRNAGHYWQPAAKKALLAKFSCSSNASIIILL
jgi:hypothetical protein